MQPRQTTIEVLFPGLAPEEQDEARHALRRYLAFILRLHARIAADPGERERLAALTELNRTSSMDSGRTFTSQIEDTDV
jgi:hypothetical protein